MKNSYTNINERRNSILSLLKKSDNQYLEVNHLASLMSVSTMTIRRDLDVLEKMGKVVRTHGGASLDVRQKEEGETYNDSLEGIKSNLAKKASTYVDNHMTLFINSSSTALRSVDFLEDRAITLITNNLRVKRKNVHPNTNIILPGGEIRFPKEALVGDLCVTNLSNIHSNVTIIGCSGISAEKGISTNNIHESKVNRIMINNTSGLVIVVSDYRKVGVDSTFIVEDFSKIDVLITDVYADPIAIREIENKGVSVIQV